MGATNERKIVTIAWPVSITRAVERNVGQYTYGPGKEQVVGWIGWAGSLRLTSHQWQIESKSVQGSIGPLGLFDTQRGLLLYRIQNLTVRDKLRGTKRGNGERENGTSEMKGPDREGVKVGTEVREEKKQDEEGKSIVSRRR